MPFCPACRVEYRAGFVECADCGVALVDKLPPAHQLSRSGAATDVAVARVNGQAIAEMWAELLGNHGIASRLRPLTAVVDNVYPANTQYEVLVAPADAQRARAVLPPQQAADRIRKPPHTPTEEEILDEVDRAIARGDVARADELLRSLEGRDQ